MPLPPQYLTSRGWGGGRVGHGSEEQESYPSSRTTRAGLSHPILPSGPSSCPSPQIGQEQPSGGLQPNLKNLMVYNEGEAYVVHSPYPDTCFREGGGGGSWNSV